MELKSREMTKKCSSDTHSIEIYDPGSSCWTCYDRICTTTTNDESRAGGETTARAAGRRLISDKKHSVLSADVWRHPHVCGEKENEGVEAGLVRSLSRAELMNRTSDGMQ